ncbi:MAG TPA: sigma-70 family RNA polymerase sigma factor [Kofleriaceae bacterium]
MDGERDDFERIVREHQAAVCAIAYAVLRDRARSEEVAQEAFLVAWRERRAKPVSAGWICAIARNLARNAARRRTEVRMTDETSGATGDVRDELIERERAAQARAALAELPDHEREAVVLYYRGDESHAQVAAALGISDAAARQRVSRARTKLRELVVAVEQTLRATKPNAAFTAAVIGAWALTRGAGKAAAATTSHARWLTVGAGAIITGAVAMGVVAFVHSARSSDPAAARRRAEAADREQAMETAMQAMSSMQVSSGSGGSHASARASAAALALARAAHHHGSGAPTPADNPPISLDFHAIPLEELCSIIGEALHVDIKVAAPAATVDVHDTDMPALDALDHVLAAQHLRRDDIPIVHLSPTGTLHDASALDITTTFTASYDRIKLESAVVILSLGTSTFIDLARPPPGAPLPTVSIHVDHQPGGVALQQLLDQTGYGYDVSSGLLIHPEADGPVPQ